MLLKETAPGKLNLGLHVLRRRSDGFHDIETVFVRLPWADELTAIAADTFVFTCSDPTLPADEGNLCVRAARRLAEAFGVPLRGVLHLQKHLPYAAGLGGGSSDAATTLRLLARLWGLDVTPEELHALAAELGSDVPFFLGAEAALARGRGERLEPFEDPATGEPYRLPFPLVVVVPPVEVPTAAAYRLVRPRSEGRPDLAATVRSNDLARWRAELVNDFEEPILAAYPVIAALRASLLEAGAAYVSLSGSGSALFGLFETEGEATAAAEAARLAGHRVLTA